VRQEFASLGRLHGELLLLGFSLVKREAFGPGLDRAEQNGAQLFYVQSHVLVRLKTNGARSNFGSPGRASPRIGQPHMSICLMGDLRASDGQVDLGWDNELGKFDRTGKLRPKSPAKVPGVQARLRTSANGHVSFVANMKQVESAIDAHIGAETWADETHFVFPDLAFDDAGLDRTWPA
jgi:hypothetical protein